MATAAADLKAQTTVYWDTNGATAGASGTTTATGTWNQSTTANWSADSTGLTAAATWATASGGSGIATFAAGTNATGSYTVTVSGTITGLRGLVFEEGTVTLSGGTLTLGASSNIDTGTRNATISSVIAGTGFGITKLGTGTLTLSGANTYSGPTNVGTAGGSSGGTIALGASNVLPGTGVTIYAGTLSINSRSDTIGALNLGGGAAGTTASVTGTSGTLTLGGNVTYDATNHPNGATISADLALGSAGRTFDVGDSTAAAADLTVSGEISGSGRSLTKTGAGTLVLTGANSYTGGTTVSAGTLQLGNGGSTGSLSSSGAISIAGGATLAFNRSADLTLSNALSGAGTITKTGAGGLRLSGNNSGFSGPLLADAGIVTLDPATTSTNSRGTGTWTFSNGAELEVVAAGTSSLGVIRGGTTNLSGVDTKLTARSAYSITGGTQNFTDGAALVGRSANAIADGTQTFSSSAEPSGFAASGQSFAGYLLSLGDTAVGDYLKTTARFTLNNGGSVTGGMQTFSGTASLQANTSGAVAGGDQIFNDSAHLRASQSSSVSDGSQTFNGNSFLWASAAGAVSGGSQSFFDSAGAYAMVAGAITGVTLDLAKESFVSVGAADALNATTNLYFRGSSGGTGGRLLLNGFNANVGYIASGAAPTNVGLIQNGGANAATLTVNANVDKTFNGLIEDGGAGALALTKAGSGNLTLGGTVANTYTGDTVISSGTLTLSNPLGLAGSTLNYNNQGGTLSFGSLTNATLGGLAGGQGLALVNASETPAGVALTVGNNNADTTYSGVLSGTGGSLTKTGTGTLTLSGSNTNTYSGATNIGTAGGPGGGTLALGASNVLPGTAVNVYAGTLAIGTRSDTIGALNLGGGAAGTTASVTGTTGTLTLGGNVAYDATNNPNGATISANLSLGSANRTFAVGDSSAAAADLTVSGNISGSGRSLTKTGAGTLVLTGANSYTGGTTVSAGTLQLGNGGSTGSLSATGGISIAGSGTLAFNRSADLTLSNTLSGAGTVTKTGAGGLRLSGNNSGFSGALFADAGVVTLDPATTSTNSRGTGTWTFSNGAELEVVATGTSSLGVIRGGTTNLSGVETKLTARSAYAITNGTQNFTDGAALVGRAANAVAGGAQTFSSTAEPAGFAASGLSFTGYLFSLGDTAVGDYLKTTARFTINNGGSVTNGTQTFNGTASLQANSSGAVAGGTQTFNDSTHLRASQLNAVVGGTQTFNGTSFLWASAAGAVSGGSRSFFNSAGAYATITGAITGVTLDLFQESFVSVGAADALSATTNLYFNGSSGGTGGRLLLHGFSTNVGYIVSGGAPTNAGLIQNGGANAATLTVNANVDKTFNGLIEDGGPGVLALTKAGSGNLTLTGANTYSGGTAITGGTLTVTGSLAPGGDVSVGTGATFAVGGDVTTRMLTGTGTVQIASESSLTVNLPNSGTGSTATFSGNLAGTSTATFSEAGAGTLTLDGDSSTFAGPIVVNSGTLVVNSANALGATSAGTTVAGPGNLVVNHVAVAAEPVTLNGGTLSGTGTASLAGPVTLASSSSTIATPASTDALTLSGAIGQTGGQRGLNKTGAGTLTLSGSSTYTGPTTVSAGKLVIGADNALPGTTQLSLLSGSMLDVASDQTIAGFFTTGSGSSILLEAGKLLSVIMPQPNTFTAYDGALNGTGNFVASGAGGGIVNLTGPIAGTVTAFAGTGATLVVGSAPFTITAPLSFVSGGSQTVSNVISGSGSIIASLGTTILTGANDYTGGTVVNGGKLIVNNTGGSATGTGLVVVNSGGVFGGSGFISGPITLNSGAIIAPGNSPGTLTVGPTTFAGGATFDFDINNATGVAGTNWDLLSVSGALTLNASTGNPFVLNLTSLTAGNTAGALANFNSSTAYSWQFVAASGGINGFTSPAQFTFNTSQFSNSLGGGSFFVTESGNSLFLNFTPVPEPSTYVLLGSGLAALAFTLRRRKSPPRGQA